MRAFRKMAVPMFFGRGHSKYDFELTDEIAVLHRLTPQARAFRDSVENASGSSHQHQFQPVDAWGEEINKLLKNALHNSDSDAAWDAIGKSCCFGGSCEEDCRTERQAAGSTTTIRKRLIHV
jgi:hypothetical protein